MLRLRLSCALLVCASSLLPAAAARAADDDLHTVKGEPKQQYFLIGAGDGAAKGKPRGLLVVMPGGDGSAEFHGFVASIREALPDDYLVAQLVAVPSAEPDQKVWPTEKMKDRKQTFSTQAFITNVVNEVKAKHKVDEARVFALGWSSSGNATYASVLTPDSPVKGAIIAMSVFHPQALPPLTGAKGKPVVILHSGEDKMIPIRIAETAEKRLKEAGAQVQFVRMSGGHGWQDDPLGRIRAAVEWLQGRKEAK